MKKVSVSALLVIFELLGLVRLIMFHLQEIQAEAMISCVIGCDAISIRFLSPKAMILYVEDFVLLLKKI